MASSSSTGFDHRDDSGSGVVRNKRRGALSCAECRRLKLKCSRVFPCSNCVKKGCSAICPDGSLTTGKGNRFVLANTEVLHEKIGQLADRVRQLEDALAQAHAAVSHERHPLLSDELLKIKRPLEREVDIPPPQTNKPEAGEATEALGSLAISQGGRTTFFGQTANSWYLLKNEEGSEEEDEPSPFESSMPASIPWLSHSFPFFPVSKTAEDIRGLIISMLPNATIARKFCDVYYRHAAWMYTPIAETDFYEHIYRPIYDPDASYHESVSSHNLAVLYMILALGTLLDLERPAHSPEASQFYQLGRVALSIDSVFEEQSVPAIQALLLMCHYMFLSHIEGPRWVMMGLVVKLTQSVGLHRDSGKWNLDSEETQKRRCLLWEIYVYDSWQSLTFGRPPSFSLVHIDSKLPFGTVHNARGDVEMSFAAWKHRFCSQCMSIVHDQAFGARSPSYKTIQDLDKKVRDFYIPPSLQVPGFGGAKLATVELEQPTVELTMQRYITFAIKEMTLFYMHRGFFARALEDHPADPMGSRYAPSVLAAYNSATSFVALIESLYKQHPALTERMWFLFTHVFSCAIVLGSIAVKTRMALAPSALSHLESATNLFSQVSDNPRAAKVLPILQKLRERAHTTTVPPLSQSTRLSFSGPIVKKEVDELSALGGMTRLVSRRTSSSPSTPSHAGSSPVSQPASPQPFTEVNPIFQPIGALPRPATSWQDYNQMPQSYHEYSAYAMISGIPQHDPSMTYPRNENNSVPLEPTADYYDNSYQDVTTNRYLPFTPLMQSPGEVITSNNDLNDSWTNFMAQFKQF